jgi:hypothetical protein
MEMEKMEWVGRVITVWIQAVVSGRVENVVVSLRDFSAHTI